MVSFWDAVKTTFTRDPREARAYILADSSPVSSFESFIGTGASGEDRQRDYPSYLQTSNAVYACVNARTKALSSLPLKIYSKRLNKDGHRDEVSTGPARDILDSVNPFWTFTRWMDMTEQALCMWGESFTFYETDGRGRPVEMWWARSDRVTVHTHKNEYVSHFTYDPGDGSKVRFERNETLWLRYPNINNQWAGLSPLGAARLAADTSSAAMKSNQNIFANGLTGAGIVMPSGTSNLTEEQGTAVQKSLERKFKGVDNAHRVAVMKFPIDIKQLSLTPKDAEFVALMNLSLEDIARAYAVPIDKVGGKRTYQNVDDSEKVFWNDCIIPEARFIAAEITEQLLPLFGGDLVAEFDTSGVAVLHEAETAKWERWKGQIESGAKVINEYRSEEGLDPVPWGDVWWGQSTLIPIDSTEKPTNPVPPALEANAGIEDSDKPEESDTDDGPADTERARRTRTMEYGSAEHVARMQRMDDAAAPWERRIAAECTRLMLDQKQSILANLRKRSHQRADVTDLVNSPFDESRWIKSFRVAMRQVIEGVVGEVSELAQDELGIAFAFDVHDPNIARAIEQQVQSFAEDVNETTWNHLRDELADGVANGENIDQLADRVEKVMGDRIRSSKETIARTETTKASTSGTLETWRQSGVVTGKQWVAALDSRTRETHVAAHGQIVGIDDVFTVGAATGPGPGQMSSARESVQCRCTIVPVLDIDMPAGGN